MVKKIDGCLCRFIFKFLCVFVFLFFKLKQLLLLSVVYSWWRYLSPALQATPISPLVFKGSAGKQRLTHTHFKAWDLKWLIAKLPGYLLLVRVKKKNITSCGHTHTSHLPQVSIHRGRQSVVKTFPSNWQRNKRGLTQLKSLYNIFLFVTLHVCKDTANAQKCTRLRALCSLQKWGFHSDSLYTWHTPYVHLLGHTNPI